MDVITIPFNYAEANDPTIVPICIADTDALGNPVHREWIDQGVVPVTDQLVRTAERLLGDKFRASEITEYAVHSLSRTHGSRIGDRPTVNVLNRARHNAIDLRAGGRRYRRKLNVELFSRTLDSIEDQYDFAGAVEAQVTLDRIMSEVERLGLDHVREILPYMLNNVEGKELSRRFGQKRNTVTKCFYRALRKAAESAGITWD
jgi:DNA-directed RNA polymerase specialized sigma24 family protein